MAENKESAKSKAAKAEAERREYLEDLRLRAGHEFDESEAASVEQTVLHKERTAG